MRHVRFTLVLLAAAVIAVLALGGSPAESAFPGANGWIAFVSNRDGYAQIYVMDEDGNNQMNISNSAPAGDRDPSWSADGSKIAFERYSGGPFTDIWVMNWDGSGDTNLTTNATAWDAQPTWSPDGSQIAFMTDRDGDMEIYVMNAVDGSGQLNLTNNPGADSAPAWSPDGSKIAFERDAYIYTMNAADGSNQTMLAGGYKPDWSPDGTKIVFYKTATGSDADIYVMNAATGLEQMDLSNNAYIETSPVWSPDGNKIAFQRRPISGDDLEIYVMNAADGSGKTNLSNNPARDEEPTWQPSYWVIDWPPTADAGGPYVTDVGVNVTLDASGSYDVGGVITSYEWDLDDDGFFDDATGVTVTFDMVGTPGVFPVALWVIDNGGGTDVDQTSVTVGTGSSVPVPAGSNVTVDVGSGVTLSCANVTTGGDATLTTSSGGPPSDPGWYYVEGIGGTPLFYDLETTANCDGSWRVCIAYDPASVVSSGDPVLNKRVGGMWQPLDNQQIIPGAPYYKVCGDVASLSLFGIMAAIGIGGIVEVSADTRSPAEASGGSSADYALPLAAAAGASALVALAAGGWYARRRWLR